jgi:hypothetical protein
MCVSLSAQAGERNPFCRQAHCLRESETLGLFPPAPFIRPVRARRPVSLGINPLGVRTLLEFPSQLACIFEGQLGPIRHAEPEE